MVDLDLSGRRLGEFVLLEQIGAGGYGAVYRCEQPVLKRDAVVKVLHTRRRWNNSARERFLREARLASRLEHPYAAHVYSFGVEEDGVLWIAMELVQGVTLGEWLKSRGPMPLEQFVPFFECVAQVVQAAHDRGIVHRDLKPSNVMVIESGGRLFPKLLDFGIAKLHDEQEQPDDRDDLDVVAASDVAAEALTDGPATVRIRLSPQRVQRTRTDSRPGAPLTRRGAVIGSAPYMSPEQWGDPCAVGPATDIYSLGCVAYETLTGRTPFTAGNTDEYYRSHRATEPPSLGDSFSPGLDRVLQRALAKLPAQRHASAGELAAELRAELRSQPREQLRSAAQQWQDRARPIGMLWGGDALAGVDRLLRAESAGPTGSTATSGSSGAPGALSELECSFVAASQRRARRSRWARRVLAVVAVAGAVGALQYRTAVQADLAEERTQVAEREARIADQKARAAQEVAEARATQAALEQGRAALLHGEPEAQAYLTEAYKRDPSASTAFMLARAMQPHLDEQARFASTYGRMWSAVFSPDGKQVVTTDDRAAQIWDSQTYKLLATLPHGDEVYQAVYSADGKMLVTVAQAMVRIWDPATGTLVRELRPAKRSTPPDYYRLAVSADGHLVAAIDLTGATIDVWSSVTGAQVATLHSSSAGYPLLAFSVDGWLAACGGSETRIFDTHTWTPVLSLPGPVRALAFGSRSRLVTGTATGDIALWEVPSGRQLQRLRPFGESVAAVAMSPDDRFVAAGGRGGVVQVWRAADGVLQSQINPRHSNILGLEFATNTDRLLTANADGTVVVVDATLGLPLSVLEGPRSIVRAAHFDVLGLRVVAASDDGTARIWTADSPYRHWSTSPIGKDCGIATTPAPQDRYVAVSCASHPVQVWDTASDRLLAELPSVTQIADDSFTSAFPAVSTKGDRAAISQGNRVQIYSLPGGQLIGTVLHSAAVSAVAFGGAGRDLISGAVDGSVRILLEDGTHVALPPAGGVDTVALLSDGRAVVSDAQRHLRVYDGNGAVLADLKLPVRVMSLRPDGQRMLALASYTGPAAPPLVIDLDTYRAAIELAGHVGMVFSARWVDGRRVLTAGADGTARLWDSVTGRLLQIYQGGTRYLGDATLLSENIVVAGDADGVLRFWDASTGTKLWTLQAHKSAIIGLHVDGGNLITRGFTGEIARWRLPSPRQVIDACSGQRRCAIVAR